LQDFRCLAAYFVPRESDVLIQAQSAANDESEYKFILVRPGDHVNPSSRQQTIQQPLRQAVVTLKAQDKWQRFNFTAIEREKERKKNLRIIRPKDEGTANAR